MKIHCLGGGPAALYFAILARKVLPEAAVTVFERNRAGDTFGFGVVFSDETLGGFEEADPESFRAITARFRRWAEIETFYRGTRTVSTGHGFAALSRRGLLEVLESRCRELGVEILHDCEVDGSARFLDADLVVVADGANSRLRELWADRFRPTIDWRQCRFSWLGTDLPLDAFTFIFHEDEAGLFQVHAYPFDDRMATWIVECREDAWRRAGLDRADEAATVEICERTFAPYLRGHRLYANRSIWRRFPTIRCERWSFDHVVLVGDAAHTAHFSIGSGTKLAMEDAIALAEALRRVGPGDVRGVLAAYEVGRRLDVLKTQKAAQTSLEWFENAPRYLGQEPLRFTFNLMTRSKRITYDNLRQRDPALVDAVDEVVGAEAGAPLDVAGKAPPPIFTPFRLRGLTLPNRVVVSPMCQYSAKDGLVDDWHLVHLGSRAIGGAGLVIAEMTDVLAEGRITHGCAGMYDRAHVAAWKRIADFVHRHAPATAIGIQLAHAGRKGSARLPWEGGEPLTAGEGAWETAGPSAIPFAPHWPAPRAMDRAEMDRVRDAFVRATGWAEEAGFDLVELHMAHGYLLSSFLSPLSNRRDDDYGGALENRLRYPLEVLRAVRAAWPAAKPLAVRISASDWMPDGSGTTAQEAVEIARALQAAGCDVVDVSSAGNVPDSEPDYGRMYQVPFADRIRHEVGVATMAVGAILGADHANTVVAAGRADLVAMARAHLADPYLTFHAAERYGYGELAWPNQYLLGKGRPRE